MTEHLTTVAEASTPAEDPIPRSGLARLLPGKKGAVVSTTTLAFAVGGALLGAAAFTAVPGGAAKAGASDSLATSQSQMPGTTGSICGSTRNTATAADTHLSCVNFGRSSYANLVMRSRNQQGRGASTTSSTAHRTSSRGAGGHSRGATGTSIGGTGGTAPISAAPAPTIPSLPGKTGKASATCATSPTAPKGTPSAPGSVSVSVSGSGGKVTIKSGKKSLKLCGTAPKAPKVPTTPTTLPAGVTSGVSSITGTVTPTTDPLGL